MREAFIYMFKDNCYYKKALIFLLLSFIESACIAYSQMNNCTGMCPYSSGNLFIPNKTNALVFQIIGLVFNSLVVGYFNTCVEAITKQINNIILPFFNCINCLLKGLKYFVAVLIPIILFALIIGFLQVFNLLLAKIIFVLLLVLYLIFGMAFIWLFANEKSFWAFLLYKKALINVLKAPLNYFKHLLFVLIASAIAIGLKFVFEFIFALLPLNALATMLIATFISAVISAYFTFVLVYLIAKSIKPDSVV